MQRPAGRIALSARWLEPRVSAAEATTPYRETINYGIAKIDRPTERIVETQLADRVIDVHACSSYLLYDFLTRFLALWTLRQSSPDIDSSPRACAKSDRCRESTFTNSRVVVLP